MRASNRHVNARLNQSLAKTRHWHRSLAVVRRDTIEFVLIIHGCLYIAGKAVLILDEIDTYINFVKVSPIFSHTQHSSKAFDIPFCDPLQVDLEDFHTTTIQLGGKEVK